MSPDSASLATEEYLHVLSDPQMSLTGTERVGVEQDFDERSEIEFEAGPGQKLAAMWHLMALTCARQLDTCVTCGLCVAYQGCLSQRMIFSNSSHSKFRAESRVGLWLRL